MLIKRPFKNLRTLGKEEGLLPFRSDAMIYGCVPAKDNKIIDRIGASSRPFIRGGFVEGDGAMYGNTGIVFNENTKIDIIFIPNTLVVNNYLFGILNSTSSANFRLKTTDGLGSISANFGDKAILSSQVLTIGQKHNIIMDKTGLYLDGVQLGNFNGYSFPVNDLSMFVLALNLNSVASSEGDYTIHSLKITHNGQTELFDFQGSTNIADDFSIGTLGTKLEWFLTHATWRGQSDAIASDADLRGYTLSDNATFYVDDGGIELYPDNYIIPRLESDATKCVGFLVGGEQADLEFRGRAKYDVDFISVDNEVSNGDFSGGTTGWTGVAATLSESNNILSNIGDGSNANPFFKSSSNVFISVDGNKLSFYAKARVTNANCLILNLRLRYGTTNDIPIFTGMKTVSNPIQNQWYEFYGTYILASGDTGFASDVIILGQQQYVDAATANGKVMEVEGYNGSNANAGVFAIKKTGTAFEDYTETQMLALVQQGYFESAEKFVTFPLSKEPIDMLADALPIGIDQSDVDNVIMLPLAVDDLVTENGDQLFFSFDSGSLACILAYYNTKDAAEIIKILLYLAMIEMLLDVNNEPVLDVNDEFIYTETEDYR